MNLKDFLAMYDIAVTQTKKQAGIIAQQKFLEQDFVGSALYAIIAGKEEVGITFQFCITALNKKEQTDNIKMLLVQSCRHNYVEAKGHINHIKVIEKDFSGNIYTVIFDALYDSGVSTKDPLYVAEQIRWFAERGQTGYAEKLRKRLEANMLIISAELTKLIKEKRKADSTKK
jgi:hypothetical protein